MFFAKMTHFDEVCKKEMNAVVDLPFDNLISATEVAKFMKTSLGAQSAMIFTYFRRPDCVSAEVVTVNAHGGISHTRAAPDSPVLLEFMEARKALGEVVLPQRYIVKTV